MTAWTAAHWASLSFTISQSLPKLMSAESVMPCNPPCPLPPLLLLPSTLPQHQGLFQWADSSHQMAKVLKLQLENQSFQWIFRVNFFEDWLFDLLDSQESFLAPQFKSINSLVLNFLCDPTLTFMHDYWKNHCFDYKALCWQVDVSAF